MEEIVEQKISIEELSDRCEILMEFSAYAPVRDDTLSMQNAYTSLLTNIQRFVCFSFFCSKIKLNTLK